jgi:endonuclease/exonuclease/phosphatase family metal-dependent hydrolase
MTYNVRYFGHALRGLASTTRSKAGIARGLASLSAPPDVVCLQEVETISLRSTIAARGRAGETQLESFMDHFARAWGSRAFPYDALHFPAHTYGPARWPVYTTGLALLVNTRAFDIDTHNAGAPRPITHHHVAMLRGVKQSRICAHARLLPRDGGTPLHVFNTHLSLPSVFAREFWGQESKMGLGPNQLAECAALAEFVREGAGDEPFVAVGDFNSAPATPVFEHLVGERRWCSAQAAVGMINPLRRDGFATAGFMHLRMHLDHIFGGNGVSFDDMEGSAHFDDRASPFYGLSDHAPLLARISIP